MIFILNYLFRYHFLLSFDYYMLASLKNIARM
jgi:hypothetical protein